MLHECNFKDESVLRARGFWPPLMGIGLFHTHPNARYANCVVVKYIHLKKNRTTTTFLVYRSTKEIWLVK